MRNDEPDTLEPGDIDRHGNKLPGYEEEIAKQMLADPLAKYPELKIVPLHMLLAVYSAGFREAQRVVNALNKGGEVPF